MTQTMNLFEEQQHECISRHIGPHKTDLKEMLKTIGVTSINEMIERTVPAAIRMKKELSIPGAMSEHEYLKHIKEVSLNNKTFKNYIGQGYYNTLVPSVILRNVFE